MRISPRSWSFRLAAGVLTLSLSGSGRAVLSQEAAPSLKDELPRIPAMEPAEALKSFAVQQGFQLELVAAEPDVSDPVDAAFDDRGRMYVAEMHGYPFSHEPTRLNPKGGGKPNDGIIRLLEDSDGDGRMDRSFKFADNITWPTSVCCWKGGVVVLAPPALWFFKDTNDDGIADVRELIYDGFNRDNVQALANNLKWGLDHRVYAAGATNPSVLTRGGKQVLSLGRTDFSFDPRTWEPRPETGGVQFGLSFDDWGRRFVCSNSNHIQQVLFPYQYLSRNPLWTVSGAIRSIAAEGAASPVFRRSPPEPWRIVRTRRRVADPKYANLPQTERVPIGFFTSATGVTVYRGAAWPEEFRGQVFIGDVGGNLIHRKTLSSNGVALLATRADQNVEFIASTDNWFRPVNFVNAPDGTLYVLDMYRETIEHPASIPDDIKEHLDLYSGDDRGRVYRLLGPNGARLKVEPLGMLSTVELVSRLNSPNGWTRETAHRLIFERQDQAAVVPLRELLRKSQAPQGRLHALYSLQGLNGLTADDVAAGLNDRHPRVREHAALLSESFLPQAPALLDRLVALTADDDQGVVFQVALSLGAADSSRVPDGLTAILSRPALSGDVTSAAMTAVGPVADQVLIRLLAQAGGEGRSVSSSILSELARMVAARGNTGSTVAVLKFLLTADEKSLPLTVRSQALLAFTDGLRRSGSDLPRLLAGDEAAGLREPWQKLQSQVRSLAETSAGPEANRASAVRLLPLTGEAESLPILKKLLNPTVPQPVQIAAVQTLGRMSAPQVGETLLESWKSFSPALRVEVQEALLSRVDRVGVLLSAIEDGTVRSAELSPERRTLLLNHPNKDIRERSVKLLGAEVNSDRAAVVKSFQPVLDMTGDAARGRPLFLQKCAVCHKVGGEGHMVGPDIVSVQNKSPADLLVAILDPNREAQPAFIGYSLLTTDGRVINGLVVGESAGSITLRRAEGKEDVVARNDIEELFSTGRTLMPDGLEKDITPQQFADIIAFIKSLGVSVSKP